MHQIKTFETLHEYWDKYNHTPNLVQLTLRVHFYDGSTTDIYVKVRKNDAVIIEVEPEFLNEELKEKVTTFFMKKTPKLRIRLLFNQIPVRFRTISKSQFG